MTNYEIYQLASEAFGSDEAQEKLRNEGFKINNLGDVYAIQRDYFKKLTPAEKESDANKLAKECGATREELGI